MRIGYAKLGTPVLNLSGDPVGYQGSVAVGRLLARLRRRNPDVTWVLVGRNDGELTGPGVENPWTGVGRNEVTKHKREAIAPMMEDLDAVLLHVGQNGISLPIPFRDETWAEARAADHYVKPGDFYAPSCAYLIDGLNRLGDRTDGQAPVAYIAEDPRGWLKARCQKWPTGVDAILSQHQHQKEMMHDRWEDPRTPEELGFEAETDRGGELWRVRHSYRHGGVEMMILPDDWGTWGERDFDEREPAGITTTSFAVGPRADRRSVLVRDYLLATFPDARVWGKWDDGSLADVPDGTVKLNEPSEFEDLLGSFRVSLVLPPAGSDWCVAKTWQSFAAGTAAFHVGKVDAQGWTIPSRTPDPESKLIDNRRGDMPLYSVRDDWTEEDLWLARFLRVNMPEEFDRRARQVASSKELWKRITRAQRALLRRRVRERPTETRVEMKLGLT